MLDLRGVKIPTDVTHPKLKRELDKLLYQLGQLSVAVGSAVEPGNNPGPTFPEENNFFYLPGRPAGQTGYGSTKPQGNLTLGSTAHSDKGRINLGIDEQVVVTDSNNRVGIKRQDPQASLHVRGSSPSTITATLISDDFNGGFVDESGGTTNLYSHIDESRSTINDADYVVSPASTGIDTNSGSIRCILSPLSDPGVDRGVTFFVRAKCSSGVATCSLGLYNGVSLVTIRFGVPLTTTFTTYAVTVNPTDTGNIVTWNDLRLYVSVTGEKFSAAGISVSVSAAWLEYTSLNQSIVPDGDNTTLNWLNESGGGTIYTHLTGGADYSDNTYATTTSTSTLTVNLQNGSTPVSTPLSVKLYARMKISATGQTVTPYLSQNVTVIASFATITPTTSFVTYSYTLTASEIASITDWTVLRLSLFKTGGATTLTLSALWMDIVYDTAGANPNDKTAIYQLEAGQTATLTEWQDEFGTIKAYVNSAFRLTLDTGSSFRLVPGAAANTLLTGNSSGDAAWGTVNLLSAYHADTLAGSPVLGDIVVANATPKWDKLVGNTTTTRKFLRQTGNGTISALPAWDTLVAGDIPALSAAAGWTDDGTVVRLTTSTDQVGIGTTSPSASLGVVNVNNIADVLLKLTAKALQTGDFVNMLNSSGRSLFTVNKTGAVFLGNSNGSDSGLLSAIFMGGAGLASTSGAGHSKAIISWGDNATALGPPVTTNDMIGCPGARIYLYKDASGQFDTAFGQDSTSTWFMPGDEGTPYYLATSVAYPGATFTRAYWDGNGDYTNYGVIFSRKNLNASSPNANGAGVFYEVTGGGTKGVLIQAPSSVTNTTTIQTLLNGTGTIPIVGNDPPAVASKALGKVDLTGQTAAIGSTNLSNTPDAGVYIVEVVAVCTVASGAGAPTLDVNLAWTDVLGATNRNATANPGATAFPLPLSVTGRTSATFLIQVASGNIAYSTTINAAAGTPQYAIYIRVMALG